MSKGNTISFEDELKEIDIKAARVRDITHNLNLNDPVEKDIYYSHLYDHIEEFERCEQHVYDDADRFAKPLSATSPVEGKRTIGIGFNMDRPEARAEWQQAFGNSISFDAARNGDVELTKEQARNLLVFSVAQRERELGRQYAPHWGKIKANERLVITDMYFQSPKLARAGTRYHDNVMNYYKTNDIKYLNAANDEIKYHSNASNLRGITKRNRSRSGKKESKKAPLFSKPYDQVLPDKKITATPGKTIIPYSFGEGRKANPNYKDYFIRRTQRDSKVRDRHIAREGVIYRTGEIEFNDFNCRCYAEPVPDNVEIKHEKFATKIVPFYIEKQDFEINVRIQKLEYQILMIKKYINYPLHHSSRNISGNDMRG